MSYREFNLQVPIWDLCDDDECDTPAIRSLFSLLSVTSPYSPLVSLYHSFYDYSSARYLGDPNASIGRGDMLIFIGDADENSLIAIDTFREATDQMNTVEIDVCSPPSVAEEVATIMKSISLSAEVSSALLDGNLGIREKLSMSNFPRHVASHNSHVMQHAQFFRGGKVIHTTRSE